MLLLVLLHLRYEDGMLDLLAAANTFLGVSLAAAKFFNNTSLLKLLLELLERAVNAFSFFYRND